MKKSFLLIITMSIVIFIAGLASAKPRLAVREFEDKSGSGAPARAITEMMTTELYNTGMFTLVERARLQDIGAEQKLGQSGLVDEATAPQVGKLLGAELMMTGAITGYHYNTSGGAVPIPWIGGAALVSNTAYVMLDIRVVNNTTGEVVLATREQGAANQTIGGILTLYGGFGSGKTGGLLASATYNAVVRVVDKMKQMGGATGVAVPQNHVLDVNAQGITVDMGMSTGVKKGDLFLVYRESNIIRGMKGEILGMDRVNIAALEVTEVAGAYSRCKVIKGSNSLRRGDLVEKIRSVKDLKF